MVLVLQLSVEYHKLLRNTTELLFLKMILFLTSAIDFMIQALDRYEDDPGVGHVSGFSFPLQNNPQEDAIFLPLFNSWGWATWSRAWKDFEWAPDKALQEMNKDASLRKRLYPYSDFFHHYLINEMVWDLLWHWKLRSLNRLGVFPANSLIWCSGFDKSATHTGSAPIGYQESYEHVMFVKLPDPIRFPGQISADPESVRALNRFLRSMYAHPVRMFYRRVRDTIKAKLKRLPGP